MEKSKPKILAIDDTPVNLLTLGAALKDDFDLQVATSGLSGISLAMQDPPDLILLDIMMPDLDGFETCQQLKADPLLRDIPVIFITALHELDSEIKGLELGAADYITKPIQVETARQRIRNLLEREQLRRQVTAQRDQLADEIKEHNKTQANLRKLSVAIEQSPASVVITDLNAVIQYVNPRFTEVTGYSAAEAIGQNPRILKSDQTSSEVFSELWAYLTQGKVWKGELINKRKNGEVYWEESHISPVKSAAGEVTHYVAVKTDITERKLAQTKLQLAAGVFASAREGIAITNLKGDMIDVNQAFTRITGYSREEALGKNSRMLNSGRQNKEFYNAMWEQLTINGHWFGEIWNRRKNGEIYAEQLTISSVLDAHGKPQNYVALFSDITAQKAQQRELDHIAHFDVLTGLPNRVLLADRLRQGMAQSVRRGQQLAVIFLDLDGFKLINDNHGHEAGDLLLMTVAKRMKQALREGDTLARIGGDEFVAVLNDMDETASSMPLLSRLLEAAAMPLQLINLTLKISASMGVTFYPQTLDIDVEQLLRQADQAMYQAKLAGKNRFHLFDTEQDTGLSSHNETIKGIRQALGSNELVLHYQPKVNMRTGQVVGAEALLRWQHPEQGLQMPGSFLPSLDDHPLAVDVGEWVIESALAQMEAWQAQGFDLPVSVNVCTRQLQQIDFVTRLRDILARHPQVKPSHLELEVLEASALANINGVTQIVEQCQEMGVAFSLDDFGTGYSSLTYLKRLPVAILKIDQSFVRDMLVDPEDLAVLEGVIGLARVFHRVVIAEGVETIAHGLLLLKLGCDLAQGFGIARPMAAQELPRWASQWQPDPAWMAQG
ncbi:MAG TPA: EAL domain-containing protein [Rhodoferax sp.]|nr:EAL domain-containing protein [Rhodoferax sp.]